MEFAHLEYEITVLKREKKEVYNDVEQLRVGIASYSTPERVERLIRSKMGYLPLAAGKKIVTLKLPEIPPSLMKEEFQIETVPDMEDEMIFRENR